MVTSLNHGFKNGQETSTDATDMAAALASDSQGATCDAEFEIDSKGERETERERDIGLD